MTSTFIKANMFNAFWLLVTVVVFLFCEEIMLAIDILPDNAALAGQMIRWLIPGCALMSINFQFQTIALAQQITVPLGVGNFLSIVVICSTSGWLVYDMEVGILLFPICKIMNEVINSLVLVYIFARRLR